MAQQKLAPLSKTEVAAFCSQMAMILSAGISSLEGISLMLEETTNKEEKKLLSQIYDSLLSTGYMYDALKETGVYPEYMLQMVQIGETTGKLDEVMKSLSTHYDREASIAQSIKSAVTYPLIMIVMMVLIILVLITKVMPIFQQVFRQLGSEMTGFSKAVLNLGTTISRYSIVLIVIVAVLLAAFFYFAKTRRGRRQSQSLLGHFRWTRSYIESIAACRLASGLALTLSSGISPDECLNYASNLISYAGLKKKIEACTVSMEEGSEFAAALSANGVFSGMYSRMVTLGSRTGMLDDVMKDIADRYQEDMDRRLTAIIAALEPALVIVLSLIVGMILLSVMLPLMGIMANL